MLQKNEKRVLEGDLQKLLLLAVSLKFPTIHFFPRKVGAIKVDAGTPDERMFRAGQVGQADLYAIADGGKHYEIELKRFTRLSHAQIVWQARCLTWRVPHIVLVAIRDESHTDTIERWLTELTRFFRSYP